MKSLVCALLLSLAAYAEPRIDCSVKDVGDNLLLVIEGNEEVQRLEVVTPINPAAFKTFGKRKMIFLWPQGLPIYPTLFLRVNGTELHYVPEIDRRSLQTTSPDPS